jgi:hypothetical protein
VLKYVFFNEEFGMRRFIVKVVPTIFQIFVVHSLNALEKKYPIKRNIDKPASTDVCEIYLFGYLTKAGLLSNSKVIVISIFCEIYLLR